MQILIVGAGAFGASSALELRRRGHDVVLIEQDSCQVAISKGASMDYNRIIRADYAGDPLYTRLTLKAIDQWRKWNSDFKEEVFVQSGVAFLTSKPLEQTHFEKLSYQNIVKLIPEHITRMNSSKIAELGFCSDFVDGYLNKYAGWARAGRTIQILVAKCEEEGVVVRKQTTVQELLYSDAARKKCVGVKLKNGDSVLADVVIVAAGAWSGKLIPELITAKALKPCSQAIIYTPVREDRPNSLTYKIPVFACDLSARGLYGFPTEKGYVKFGYHGHGLPWTNDANDDRVLRNADKNFVINSLPLVFDSSVVSDFNLSKTLGKVCFYFDSFDGDFWIDRHSDVEGLVVATGGTGHGFKFVPILGQVIGEPCL
jgi:glycine/D-amino acid oxidase-like deaminating enzyme